MSVVEFAGWRVWAIRDNGERGPVYLAGPVSGPLLPVTGDRKLARRWGSALRARREADRLSEILGDRWSCDVERA